MKVIDLDLDVHNYAKRISTKPDGSAILYVRMDGDSRTVTSFLSANLDDMFSAILTAVESDESGDLLSVFEAVVAHSYKG